MTVSRGILAASIIVVIVLGTVLSIVYARVRPSAQTTEAPWAKMPARPVPADHAHLISGPFADGSSVTRACLECHPGAARQVMATSHWTWAGQKVKLPGRDEIMRVGKRNLINNFCIHAGPNMAKCGLHRAADGPMFPARATRRSTSWVMTAGDG